MARPTAPTTAIARLVGHLVNADGADPLVDELHAWLTGSSRFRAFVETHRDKIRKKLRTATDAEARRDVRVELRVAQLLLAERRIELAFEAYGSGNAGPDFTIAFRGHRAFNLEVTRMRRPPAEATTGGPLLPKLHQLPPAMPNVLLVAVRGDRAGALDVAGAVRGLRARADAKDEPFFRRRGFDGSRAFYERFLRLGAVIAWCEDGIDGERASIWVNRSARTSPPDGALRATLDCLSVS
jgi:hypothetical protein